MKNLLFIFALVGCGSNKAVHDLGTTDQAVASTDDSAVPGDAAQVMDATMATPDATMVGRALLYVGGNSATIGAYSIGSNGALTQTSTVASASPTFLAVNAAQSYLYAVAEDGAAVSAFSIDRKTGALTSLNSMQSSQGQTPAFLSLDPTNKWLLVPNYGDGVVATFPIGSDGKIGAVADTETAGMNAHMMITDPSGKFVFVPCLGSDWVAQYTFNSTTGKLTPNATPHMTVPAKTGPRHLAFAPNGKFVYLVGETGSLIFTLSFDSTTGTLSVLDMHSTLPPGFSATNKAAEVHVHPTGKWVYASNRGADDIVRFAIDATSGKLTYVDAISSGGATPRDFTIDPTGTLLYAANMDGNNVVPFRIAADGTLSTTAAPVTFMTAEFVGVINLTP